MIIICLEYRGPIDHINVRILQMMMLRIPSVFGLRAHMADLSVYVLFWVQNLGRLSCSEVGRQSSSITFGVGCCWGCLKKEVLVGIVSGF